MSDISADIVNVDVDESQWNTSIDWAGSGLVSSAYDLDNFLRGLFEGELLGNPDLFAESMNWVEANDEFEYYGLGIGVRTDSKDGTVASCDHGGFWGSYMAYFPGSGSTLVLTINQVEFDGFDKFLQTIEGML